MSIKPKKNGSAIVTNSYLISTPVLSILTKKKLLHERLHHLGLDEDNLFNLLKKINRDVAIPINTIHNHYLVGKLQANGLLTTGTLTKNFSTKQRAEIKKSHLSLIYVFALNFELTYRCNKACLHCLQKALRVSSYDQELNADIVKKAIYEAWFSGLIEEKPPLPDRGLNFTGGEVLYKYKRIFELIEYARSLNLAVRLNTNNWWGNKRLFIAGGKRFRSPSHLIGYLKDIGLAVIAFSFDDRFEYERTAFARLVNSVKVCEQNKLYYQIVCTGCTRTQTDKLFSELRSKVNKGLSYNIRVKADMVDIGGAADSCKSREGPENKLNHLAEKADCSQKGFYTPWMLHVNPFGGVRSCLYAIGLSNMGNLLNNSIIEIINNFPSDPISLAYKEQKLMGYCERLFTPFSDIYKSFKHPCTANAVLARLIEATSLLEQKKGRITKMSELLRINLQIANDLNLANDQLPCQNQSNT